ncbi:hypothetical protein WALSEDRAFT_60244 [Wallemia mellicola CBS 633.66]|uniref:Rhodanese domain-containing protein n=1 Tax=Wallemia mellicola (strain ATCC MYA-4683 / CBS 633.66) TaxID=671144 RepID=I4YCU5_WALMC|nr:hypothetical protein WALSEDRAFT_60244 [Wallemia mellicola CBS 633.66]EIM21787.1 hypothetical protein WALSEDRAFT_60244 [Wallemia mellicola CBS 633.66]|eukprot:XP_006958093.1 hypothetical protein WALSEDRAFT_60244 [Wallemia mellicola CBS 633.66]
MAAIREEISNLRKRIQELELKLENSDEDITSVNGLDLGEYRRYGRQMVLNGIGLPGQLSLKNASVLIIGAGGLGCPASQYLAATGIGHITIVDGDTVEISNLQRQILHSDDKIGLYKADSIKEAVKRINPNVTVSPILEQFSTLNAQDILTKVQPDVVLDCTDNPSTRYLISDAVVIHNRTHKRASLVSAAATGFNGQIITLCYEDDAPCYRCIVPKSPPKQTVTSCDDQGILGVVTGVLGTMQATETIKLLTGLHPKESSLTVYSALAKTPFRTVKMRARKKDCFADGDDVPLKSVQDVDYVTFTGGDSCGVDLSLSHANEISVEDFVRTRKDDDLVIDTRPNVEYGICHLEGSTNLPIVDLLSNPSQVKTDKDIYVLCRRGNDSQIATDVLMRENKSVKNVKGGLARYSGINKEFPLY